MNGDGKISKIEADLWGIRNGGDITVDGNKIDLTGFNVKHLNVGEKGAYGYPTTKVFQDLPFETASVYGGSNFKFVDGQWQMQSQRYHYKFRSMNTIENTGRNILTFVGHPAFYMGILSPSFYGMRLNIGLMFKPFKINIKY